MKHTRKIQESIRKKEYKVRAKHIPEQNRVISCLLFKEVDLILVSCILITPALMC